VKQLEGKDDVDMKEYSNSNSDKYKAMVNKIRENLDLTTLKFQNLDDLVEAIGLPKEKLCTHCWDGSSYLD
jgi:amidophosphoribosyltransferase